MSEPPLIPPDYWQDDQFQDDETSGDCGQVNGANGDCPLGREASCRGCKYNVRRVL